MFSSLWNHAASLLSSGSQEDWDAPTPVASRSPLHSRSESTPVPLSATGQPPFWPESCGDAGFSEELSEGASPWTGSASNKLFIQLLDDLDDLTSSTPSAHRRRRAREIFSEWLFSGDMRSPGVALSRNSQLRRSLATETGLRRTDDIMKEEKTVRRCSGDFSGVDVSRCQEPAPLRRCRTVDTPPDYADRRRSFPLGVSVLENEQDSGYHTGNRNLLEASCKKRQPSDRTLTRDDLRRRINTFNTNTHGLVMEPPTADDNTFRGFIRVHMNLIRPINMCISVEPPTVFDISGDTRQSVKGVEVTSFYLPKDTTKVIHITSQTGTQEVIQVLLFKYHITDSPRKFALYEKTAEPGKKAVLRRLADDELPLQICLSWTSDGVDRLDHNQFVLQENDTGEILWEAFSLPELENFLLVLNREEEEYISQIKDKYRMLEIHMKKRLQSLAAKRKIATDKRTPPDLF